MKEFNEPNSVVSDQWIAEMVRRSTAAQGLPEYIDDPAVADPIARISRVTMRPS